MCLNPAGIIHQLVRKSNADAIGKTAGNLNAVQHNLIVFVLKTCKLVPGSSQLGRPVLLEKLIVAEGEGKRAVAVKICAKRACSSAAADFCSAVAFTFLLADSCLRCRTSLGIITESQRHGSLNSRTLEILISL
jgi:hypothetical protein